MMGFYSMISQGVLDEFPSLRLCFLEAGSEWLPYAIRQLERSWRDRRLPCKKNPREYLEAGNVFISIEADEDVGYLLNLIGEDQLIIASDYPHEDPSRAENMVGELHSRTDLDPKLRQKILSHNAARLYAL